MKITVTERSAHPEFGGEQVRAWDFSMDDARKAEAKFLELEKLNHGVYGYVTITIIVNSS
jgi:hypothetical protein